MDALTLYLTFMKSIMYTRNVYLLNYLSDIPICFDTVPNFYESIMYTRNV